MSILVEEDLEMTLDAAGVAWTRRDECWAVTAAGEAARELRITSTGAGVRVEAVLVEWDETFAESLEALALFLETGGRDVTGVFGAIEETRAVLMAEVPAEEMECRLGEALRAVSAGCRLLAREARALLSPELARVYVSFHG